VTMPVPVVLTCDGCQSELAPTMTACPGCGRLVHAKRLASLAATARAAEAAGDISAALAAWREALPLRPPASRQRQVIAAKITDLGKSLPFAPTSAPPPNGDRSLAGRLAAGLAAIGAAAWKLKALLLGLTKATTLLTMLASFGIYWTIWGWRFALGLVLSIYVHEMGHVIALRRYGFKATAPMFIPGLGALIRLQQQVVNPREDAAIGLAGPVYGLGAALASLGLWVATRQPIFAAVAGVGAWINLFNLLPLYTLDGGRAFHALSRVERVVMAAAVGGCWYFSQDGLLVLLGIVCLGRAFAGPPPDPQGDRRTAVTYAVLVAALTAVSVVRPTDLRNAARSGDPSTDQTVRAWQPASDR